LECGSSAAALEVPALGIGCSQLHALLLKSAGRAYALKRVPEEIFPKVDILLDMDATHQNGADFGCGAPGHDLHEDSGWDVAVQLPDHRGPEDAGSDRDRSGRRGGAHLEHAGGATS